MSKNQITVAVIAVAVVALAIGWFAYSQRDTVVDDDVTPYAPGVENPTSTPPKPAEEISRPPAPGPFAADAVRALAPTSLRVGENRVTAEVRGYMFFEGETRLALYDGTREIDIGSRPDGLPNTVVSAGSEEWMIAGYVPVAQTINIPAEVAGKTLVLRFIANDPRDDARPRYWGTLIRVE